MAHRLFSAVKITRSCCHFPISSAKEILPYLVKLEKNNIATGYITKPEEQEWHSSLKLGEKIAQVLQTDEFDILHAKSDGEGHR